MKGLWNLALTIVLYHLFIECSQLRPDKEIYRELEDAEMVGDMIFESSNTRMAKRSRKNWPDGIIPYIISNNVSSHLRSVVLNATNYIMTHTCLRFRPALQIDNYWIRFLMVENADANTICSSYVGWLNKKDQGVFMGKRCVFGVMIHELLHTIGFYHEHTRNDRDKYICINKTNYASIHVANNYKLDNDGCSPSEHESCIFDDYNVNYNYESIMHYCQYCGSKDPNYPVFTTKNTSNGIGDPKKVGQREGFSRGDWLMANKKYGCNISEQYQPSDLPEEPLYQDPHELNESHSEPSTSTTLSTPASSVSTTTIKITKATTTTGRPTFCSVVPFHPCRHQSR